MPVSFSVHVGFTPVSRRFHVRFTSISRFLVRSKRFHVGFMPVADTCLQPTRAIVSCSPSLSLPIQHSAPRQTSDTPPGQIDNGSETCPACQSELTSEQVRDGWSSDPNDYTTECRAVVDLQAAALAAVGSTGTGWAGDSAGGASSAAPAAAASGAGGESGSVGISSRAELDFLKFRMGISFSRGSSSFTLECTHQRNRGRNEKNSLLPLPKSTRFPLFARHLGCLRCVSGWLIFFRPLPVYPCACPWVIRLILSSSLYRVPGLVVFPVLIRPLDVPGSPERGQRGGGGGGTGATGTLPTIRGAGGGGTLGRRRPSFVSSTSSPPSSSKPATGASVVCGRRFVSRFSVHSTAAGWEGTTGAVSCRRSAAKAMRVDPLEFSS